MTELAADPSKIGPNLGKIFTSTSARPIATEDEDILIPGDWIKEKDNPFCYKFKRWDGDMAVGAWEGKEFLVPHHLLMVVEAIEGRIIEKFFKIALTRYNTRPETYIIDRTKSLGVVADNLGFGFVVDWLGFGTASNPASGKQITYNWERDSETIASFAIAPQELVSKYLENERTQQFKVGDKVEWTDFKQAIYKVIKPEKGGHTTIELVESWGFYRPLPPIRKRVALWEIQLLKQPTHPWDSPQQWGSAGVQCKYEGEVIFWGEKQFEVTPKIKEKYLNPRVLVDFLKDSWQDLQCFVKYLTKYGEPASEKEIIQHFGCKKSLAKSALNLGLDLGVLTLEGGKYRLSSQPSINTSKPVCKPTLPPDAPIAIVLFAGGGGVEAGMVEAGIRPLIAVEFDPKKPKLSSAIADCHERNFKEYGGEVIRKTVQEITAKRLDDISRGRHLLTLLPRNPDFFHASPMCSNFSNAKAGDAIETQDDIDMATAVAEIIRYTKPNFFTLENVKRYRNSESFKIIAQALDEEGYTWDGRVMTLLDCQSRERFIVRAAIEWLPPPPSAFSPVGWYETIADLIPKMADSELVEGQKKSLEKFLATNEPTPLLIDRTGARGEYKAKPAHLPCNTLRSSVFTDEKGANRNKFADIWLPNGTVKSVSIEAAARLQGFPDWYEFPSDTATAGSIIGYSVPPKFAAQLFKSLQQQPPIEVQIQLCLHRIIKHNWHIQNLEIQRQSKSIKEGIKEAKSAIASEDDRINQLLEELIIYRQLRELVEKDEAKKTVLKLIANQNQTQQAFD